MARRGRPQRWAVAHGGLAAARKQLTAAKAQRDRGDRIAANPRMTFNAAADVWLEAHVARLRPTSRETYGTHLMQLRKRFGRTRLSAITPAEVGRHVADMDRAGAAGWTQRGRLTVLSGVFTYAGRHLGHTGINPVSLLDRYERPDVEDEREHRVLTDDEIDRTLDAAAGYRLLLQAAAQTGARKAEVLGLTWGDVDTQVRTVSFNRQLDRRGQRVELKTKRSKRCIAITPDLAAALTEHRLACGRPPSSALVFTRPDGTAHSHASRTVLCAWR